MSKELEKHYGKFCEEKRLLRKHGQVEFLTSMKYIKEMIEQARNGRQNAEIKILDVGAGTGRYSVAFAEEGYDVTAIELVKYNLGILKAKKSSVKAYQGNALDLKRFKDESFDIVLVFGPMYHLYTKEDKVKAILEAKRVVKKDGTILVAYCMNEYSVVLHAFRDNFVKEAIKNGKLTEDFHTISSPEDLYEYVRIEDIDEVNREAGVQRIKIIAADGPADYMRNVFSAMDDETFELFMKYHFATCEREDLIGASAHTLDIVRKTE